MSKELEEGKGGWIEEWEETKVVNVATTES